VAVEAPVAQLLRLLAHGVVHALHGEGRAWVRAAAAADQAHGVHLLARAAELLLLVVGVGMLLVVRCVVRVVRVVRVLAHGVVHVGRRAVWEEVVVDLFDLDRGVAAVVEIGVGRERGVVLIGVEEGGLCAARGARGARRPRCGRHRICGRGLRGAVGRRLTHAIEAS
jgi:hypothetical protein